MACGRLRGQRVRLRRWVAGVQGGMGEVRVLRRSHEERRGLAGPLMWPFLCLVQRQTFNKADVWAKS